MHTTLVLAGIGGFSVPEMLIALLIVLLLFGARKLPELAHSMGSSIQAFKKGMKDGTDAPPPTTEVKSDDPSKH
jgi:sec-independent protein translocase protein TatA